LKGASAVDVNARKVVIETVVRKAIDEIKKYPEISSRRLVDLALDYSQGRFQKNFFEMAQTMLEDDISPYYDLVQDIADSVSKEKLVRFGMNLGYNSCTMGANTIRLIEAAENFNIPWSVFWAMESSRLRQNFQRCSNVVSQGEALGIYTWQLFCMGDIAPFIQLAQEHPDCAFVLYFKTESLSMAALDMADGADNIMLVPEYDENTAGLCSIMRERELLYSVCFRYDETDFEAISSGELCFALEALCPAFMGFLPKACCSKDTQDEMYAYILDARKNQLFKGLLWEVKQDAAFVDSVISSDACSVFIDNDGFLVGGKTSQSVFSTPLKELFRVNLSKAGTLGSL